MRRCGPEDFEILEQLGEGTFSEVHRCVAKDDSEQCFAVKIVNKQFIVRHNKVDEIMKEKEALILLKDVPLILQLHATAQDKLNLYFLLDFCAGGELHSLVRKHGGLDMECIRFCMAEVVLALHSLKEHKIIHRDVKPENILLSETGHIVLADFGTCKILDGLDTKEEKQQRQSTRPFGPERPRTKRKSSFVGTPEYIAPEVLRNEEIDESLDIWSLGCCVYFCVTSQHCFKGETEYLTFQKVLQLDFEYPADFPEEARLFCESTLNPDPSQRLTLEEVRNHEFFKNINFDELVDSVSPLLGQYPDAFTSE